MPAYPLAQRTWIGAVCAVLAIVLAVLGLLGIAPADAKIMFVSVLLLGVACLA